MASRKNTNNNSGADVLSDGHYIELVRGGDMSAFDHLYERHISIAAAVARRNVDNPSDAEDVVAEAFQAVLQNLVAGKGPNNFFRAYLLSTVTRLSHHRNRKAGSTLPSSDDAVLDRPLSEPDAAVKAFESDAVAKAFQALPERWKAVLWYLDVERMKPAAVAPILGLSPNAVSALALRAREGLRRQYLQAHIAEEHDDECAMYASKLGHYIRGGLSRAASRKMRQHLGGCSKCTRALAELKDVQGRMRAVLLPLVTGVPLALWAGKGAGLGVLGGLVPVKAAIVAPAISQPVVMAVVAAGLGLALGASGLGDQLIPDAHVVDHPDSTHPEAQPSITLWPPATPSHQAPESPSPTQAPAPEVLPPSEPDPAQEEPREQENRPSGEREVAKPAEVQGGAPATEVPPGNASEPPSLPQEPTPAPSAPEEPMTPKAVSAYVWTAQDADTGLTAMQVNFIPRGAPPVGPGTVTFSLGPDARIQEKSLTVPHGWSCSFQGPRAITCATGSIQPGNLNFHMTARTGKTAAAGVLTYSFRGNGFSTGKLRYEY
ncbi:RNA polymerase subunit sigma-70 [Paenarthrobacter ureafaciens]|uniref:sigma-70 family RNA polymerase sigma factor n=1 Tax=Paenarthrobacter ureafaciens TaxID=37931 RepID=UPI0015BED873|nr:sigma-70 family RNA polymerase sigma factor [Paenarthrobacter ureafaciens]MEC3851300.1 sigma-70 family RNA polymerase sigma factor [Paenarthrobacter ureafaciens]NWL28701.1 RNA polymerase subunit sigma-70 [Paenarthrobacter ureafaciens]